MNYNMCYSKGDKNKATADKMLKYFVNIMESSHQKDETFGLKNILKEQCWIILFFCMDIQLLTGRTIYDPLLLVLYND